MGHYLGEMEEDGVPRAWKFGRRNEGAESKYSSLRRVCTQRMVEQKTGVSLSWGEVEVFLGAFEERQAELKMLEEELNKAHYKLVRSIVLQIRPGSEMTTPESQHPDEG